MPNKGAGRYGTHRGAFEKNKKKIFATQSCCGICGKPVASAAGFVMPGKSKRRRGEGDKYDKP